MKRMHSLGSYICKELLTLIYIEANGPSLNKKMAKYQLINIWNKVLFNIQELKVKFNPS